jgi:hypothetical protein
MLLTAKQIVLVSSDKEDVEADEVAVPCGSFVYFISDKGWFRFYQAARNLEPRVRDDHKLSEILDEVIKTVPGAGGISYRRIGWTAFSRVRDGEVARARTDRFMVDAGLMVFSIGLLQEVELGTIQKIRVFTP